MRKMAFASLLLVGTPLLAQPIDPMANDKVPSYDWVRPQADYVRREVMLPMRDGTKLGIGIEIFRGRYVHGFATPAPLKPRQT